jgi:TPR repeat protein
LRFRAVFSIASTFCRSDDPFKDKCESDGFRAALSAAGRRRAVQGDGDANFQFRYGLFLLLGREVSQDEREGARYLKLLADQQHPDGLNLSGCCLQFDKGGTHNITEGARYY